MDAIGSTGFEHRRHRLPVGLRSRQRMTGRQPALATGSVQPLPCSRTDYKVQVPRRRKRPLPPAPPHMAKLPMSDERQGATAMAPSSESTQMAPLWLASRPPLAPSRAARFALAGRACEVAGLAWQRSIYPGVHPIGCAGFRQCGGAVTKLWGVAPHVPRARQGGAQRAPSAGT